MTRYIPSFALLLAGAATAALVLGGCDSLTEYNDNPNQPTQVNPNNVLANAQRGLADETVGNMMRGSSLYAQYTTQNFYTTDGSRYGAIGYGWGNFYEYFNDLEKVKELAKQNDPPNASNLEAIAIITQAWGFQILTDAYGDIPFKQALKGSANRDPAYTPQQDIYPALVDSLDKALGLIQSGQGPSGDVINGGDMQKWSRFANGLKMRIGIRASDANESFASSTIQSAMGNALQSNDDNVYFQFAQSSPYYSPYYNNRYVQGRDDYDVSERFIKALKQYEGAGALDPRLDAFAEQTSNGGPPCEDGSGNYDGFPFGMEQSNAQARQTSRPTCVESRPESFFPAGPSGEGDAYNPMMYYDEVLITKAEAAARGLISGDAKSYLEDAIRASIDFYGSQTDADIDGQSSAADAYVNAVLSDYDSEGMQVIGEQRWILFYMNNIQGWNTWRRMDFSDWIGPPTGGVAGDLQGRYAPLRIDYPSSEFSLNEDNVVEAANRQFGDVENEGPGRRVWWDTEEPPAASEAYQP